LAANSPHQLDHLVRLFQMDATGAKLLPQVRYDIEVKVKKKEKRVSAW
jgi:hypothetical protein